MLSNKRRREGVDAGTAGYESDPDLPPSAAAAAVAAPAVAEDPALSAEQQAVLRAIRSGDNIFLTGSAGVGKSVTLRAIIRTLGELYGPEHVAVCASTGIAAEPLGGSTLHSFAGCGMGEYCESRLVGPRLENTPRAPFCMRFATAPSFLVYARARAPQPIPHRSQFSQHPKQGQSQ